MDNITFLGIDKSYIPLSNAFTADTFDFELILPSLYSNIINITFSIESMIFDSFSIYNKNYSSVLVDINIRIEYVCANGDLKYNISNYNKMMHICTNNNISNIDTPIYTEILYADLIVVNSNIINLSLVVVSSLGI